MRRIFLNSVINIAALMIAGSTIIQSASIMAVEVANTILPSCDCLAPISRPEDTAKCLTTPAVEVANTILPSCDCLAPIDAP